MLDENAQRDAIKMIQHADMLVVLGTSLVVYPAAGFIRYFTGDKLVMINRTATSYDNIADLVIQANFKSIFPHLTIHEDK